MSRKEFVPVAPTGITPDEVLLLRRRQEWRGRILRICIRLLGGLKQDQLSTLALDQCVESWRVFVDLSNEIETDMQRLLESEMVVPQLEMHRHGANYFLDTLIRQVRDREQERSQAAGREVRSGPLESLTTEELEAEVRGILEAAPDTLPVFLNDLVKIQQFELEVQRQRRRLQFLLGCDRALRDLAESNAEIIESSYEDFREIVQQFGTYCRGIEVELAPMLQLPSPYERLQKELDNSREQLSWLVENVFRPTEELRDEVERLEARLAKVDATLTQLVGRAGEVRALRIPAEQREGEEISAARHGLELKARLIGLKDELQAVNATPLRELCHEEREDLATQSRRLTELLGPLEEQLIVIETEVVDPALDELRRAETGEGSAIDLEDLHQLHVAIRGRLATLERSFLSEVMSSAVDLRDRNLTVLKERICQDLGFVRTTFLQPSFAHIAAEDPRSMHTAQYFYLKEFADEAERSQQLLESAHVLWQELEQAQLTRIRGLRFTANNLNKIADRVLLERHAVPSGPGWKELSNFLHTLKDRLVPRLRMICNQPGVRFDDKDQLSRYASQVAESCSMLLAQRDTAQRLVEAIGALDGAEDGAEHRRYEETILRITCEEMAARLRAISKTLVELIPYVGAMVGSIRMRTSLSFNRQIEGTGARPGG